MPLLQIIVLAVIQGLTEFLPISSSGHLALVPAVTGWPDQGLKMDVAVHVGTLGAIVLYFWRDLWQILTGLLGGRRARSRPGQRLALYLFVATIPVIVAGGLLVTLAPNALRDPAIIAWTMLGFGVVLYAADRLGMTMRRIEHMNLGMALIIGLSQVLALVPGTSRSGITMTAARMLGFERPAAVRFSLLLSIPTIIAAGAATGHDLYQTGDAQLTADAALAAALAFVAALAAIAVLMQVIKRIGFTPFVIYRVVLGIALLVWIYAYA